jgi:competence protein ComEA
MDMRRRPVSPASALALVLGFAAAVRLLPRGPGPAGAEGGPLVPDVNSSPERHLVLLPGIGPSRAAAIVEERERGGPFAGLGDLARVRGIGPATADGIAGSARVCLRNPTSGPRPSEDKPGAAAAGRIPAGFPDPKAGGP